MFTTPNEDELAMAALHKHLTQVHAHYGVDFILVPLADVLVTSLNSFRLSPEEKQRFLESVSNDFRTLLQSQIA